MAKYQVQATTQIESLILTIRGLRVLLDADLAKIYGVTTRALNQAVKRNAGRFPDDFAFQLANQEVAEMRSQNVTSSRRNLRRAPMAFTEHGAIMLASILSSPIAIEASIRVVRAFVAMREQLAAHKECAQMLAELESRISGHDAAIANLFEAIRQLVEPPLPENRRQIGFMREATMAYRIRKNSRN